MKQTGVKKYRRTAAMLAATFTALLAVYSFSFVQAEENTEKSFPVLEEIPFADMLKDQMDRNLNAPATYANTGVNLPASYDLRDYNLSTSVKDQDPLGTCWAFAATAALESNYLKQTKQTGTAPDFSEKHLAYFAKHTRPEGLDQAGEGFVNDNTGNALSSGQVTTALGAYAAWQGPVKESDVPYQDDNGTLQADASWTVDEKYRSMSEAHLQKAEVLPSPANWTTGKYVYDAAAVEQTKEAIYNNGAVSLMYYVYDPDSPAEKDTILQYWNQEHGCYYTTGQNQTNHAVTIIGWDDNYSKDNFNGDTKPAGNGAFLIKNSWGENPNDYSQKYDYMHAIPNDEGGKDYGYFWISYYDESLTSPISYTLDIAEDGFDYDNIEQYDYLGVTSVLSSINGVTQFVLMSNGYTSYGMDESVANVFTADDYVTLEAVSVFANRAEGSTAEIAVYIGGENGNPESGTLVSKQTTAVDGNGFYTIDLDKPVNLRPGDTYTVVQTINSGSADNYLPVEVGYVLSSGQKVLNLAAVSNAGESYISCDGQWVDVSTLMETDFGEMPITLGNAMIKSYTNDRQATVADDVIAMIQNLPEITALEQESDVVKARDAYDALTEDLKAQVYNLNLLEAAELKITSLKDDQAAADKVSEMIENLGEITGLDQEQAVLDARAAYESLTAEQKAKVMNLAMLEAAEQKIQDLKKEQSGTESGTGSMQTPETEQVSGNVNSPSTGEERNYTVIYIAVALSAAIVVSIVVLKVRKEKE